MCVFDGYCNGHCVINLRFLRLPWIGALLGLQAVHIHMAAAGLTALCVRVTVYCVVLCCTCGQLANEHVFVVIVGSLIVVKRVRPVTEKIYLRAKRIQLSAIFSSRYYARNAHS